VSHDLKAPLAAIDGFVHVLSERLKDRLDEREARYLDRVRAGVGNMFALIDAMLALHQLSRGTRLQRRWVDVAALAESVVAELREADPGRVAWIRIERPLSVYGDAALLGIVLRNLVGNAWKFSAHRPQVEIEIAEQADGPSGFTTLCISDRGAGFDPAMAHKLFAPFQRLHPSSEFPGTGVGLATVHRIVQRHAGMIRADSAPGEGATFWVSLPLPSGDADTVSGE
jgi:signal transduction histidine kinase